MAKHAWFKVRKDGPATWAIQESTPQGYRTVGHSTSRTKANMSAGIRSSERMIKTRGRKR